MASRWNPPYTWFDALCGLGLLFGITLVVVLTILFWIRATRPVVRALVQTQIAAHGGPVVVRDTPAIQRSRAAYNRDARAAGWQ